MPRVLSDPLSQYTALRMHYAEKSTEDAASSNAANAVPRIVADSSRVYWPGQEVSATVSISEAACSREGELEDLSVELKGEVHSFIIRTTRNDNHTQRHTVPYVVPIFSYTATLYSNNDHFVGQGIQVQPISSQDESSRAWQVRTRLPFAFVADNGKQYSLPPSFKDSTASIRQGTSFIVYSIKATAKRNGAFKRDARVWTPVLVTSMAERSLYPDVLVMPPPAPPGSLPVLPRGWQRITSKQIIHKALFRDRGELEAQLFSPPFASVSPGMPLPFLLLLVVRTKAIADATTPNDIVPSLPGDEKNRDYATFSFKRYVRSSSTQGLLGRSHHDTKDKIPVHLEWSRGHLEGAGPGHGWTPCAHDGNAPTQPHAFPYYTTALLSGFLTMSLSPAFEVPTLAVSYSLHLSIPMHGLRNKLSAQLGDVGASSGVTAADLAALDVAEASRRAVGTGRISHLQSLHHMQGDAKELHKLNGMAERPSFGDAGALPWVNEKAGRPVH